MRVLVGGRRVLVGEIAMFLGGHGVHFRLVMVAMLMMVRGLMVMMGGGMMVSRGSLMMLARRMLRGFGHLSYSSLRAYGDRCNKPLKCE